MNHLELLYQKLQEGKIKELVEEPSIKYRLRKVRYRQPLYTFYKTKQGTQFQIRRVQLTGYLTKYKELYIVKPTEIKLTGEYYNTGRAGRALVYQQLGDAKASVIVLFGKGAIYRLELKHKIEKPQKVTIVADIRKRRWRPDAHYDTILTFGIADDRPRSANTYPEPKAENEKLDIKPSWEEGTDIYPKPKPTDIKINAKPVSFISGSFKWDIHYRVPTEPTKVRLSYTVINNSDKVLKINEWSLMIAILYDDMLHMSYANKKIGYKQRQVNSGDSTTYTFDITLPSWVYGYVTVTHAMNFYKEDMFVYGGGPVWNFKLGRVMLP